MALSFYALTESGGLIELEPHGFYLLLEESHRLADLIEIRFPRTEVIEKSSMTVTVNFRTHSTGAASTPTTIHYRVDCLSTEQAVTEWTSVSAAAEVEIVLTPTESSILDSSNEWERKQLTVKIDSGLSTQVLQARQWRVKNIYGVT